MNDVFKIASREAFRFDSPVGPLTSEQLWQLPLTSTRSGKASLNDCAIRLSRQVKDLGEESFVDTATTNPAKARLEQQLEVVKAIIAERQEENAAATAKAAALAKRAKIEEIIASKQDKALEGLSVEELEALKKDL